MLGELLVIFLSAASIITGIAEDKEEKQKEKLRELQIKVFCHAVRHKLEYNEVVEMLQNKTLTFEDIDKDSEEYENSTKNNNVKQKVKAYHM